MMRDPLNVFFVCAAIVIVAITAGATAYNIALVLHPPQCVEAKP